MTFPGTPPRKENSAANEQTQKEQLKGLLKKHFGYDSFRALQEKVIDSVMCGKDTLVLMPTGGGKSMCYQLPAVAFSGVTLVISPLIALMKDQVDSLVEKGISAAFINSSLSFSEIKKVKSDVIKGDVKILYLAPERFNLPAFRNWLKRVEVSLIAVDEAHCISEWGHDFRPDYTNMKLREDFSDTPVIALTATATRKVVKDILKQLQLKAPKVEICSFNRPNLNYFIHPKKNVFEKMSALLEKYEGRPTIIYCFSRRETEQLAMQLNGLGHKSLPYHAGLEQEVRKETQEKFLKDEVTIITATVAFGMGIDKPDVRLVVHYGLPKSLEGYYQETGRAGRDGLPSECVLFYSYGDRKKHDFFIERIEKFRQRFRAKRKLAEVLYYCQSGGCRRRFILNYFDEKFPHKNCASCDICKKSSPLDFLN